MDNEAEKFKLVTKLRNIAEGLLKEPNIRYRPREKVTAKLLKAYKILDRIGELENYLDAPDIQDEVNWNNSKQRISKTKKFVTWLKRNGVNTANFSISHCEDQHYKLLTSKTFLANKTIFQIPSKIIFSKEVKFVGQATSLENYAKDPVLSDFSLIGALVAEIQLREKSDFKVFFDMLPRIKAHTHPLSFGKDEILKIQHFDNLFCDSVLAIANFYRDYCMLFFEFHKFPLELDCLTFRRFLWARLTVDIYATTIIRTDAQGFLLNAKSALVPLLDMCEFQRPKSQRFDLKYLEGDVDDYVCISLEKIRSNMPITRYYTNPVASACFIDYGFVPYCFMKKLVTYRLALELNRSCDEHFERRLRIFGTLGLKERELFEINVDDLGNCGSNVTRRLFLYVNMIRANTALLDLIERDESDLTFLTKPTRMTWLYLAVQLRINQTHLNPELINLYNSLKDPKDKNFDGVTLVGRMKVIFYYAWNESNCIELLQQEVKKEIEILGPDKPGIPDKYDCNETKLRELYHTTVVEGSSETPMLKEFPPPSRCNNLEDYARHLQNPNFPWRIKLDSIFLSRS